MTGDDDALRDTAETYEAAAEPYERAHRDRSVVAAQVERFVDAVPDGGRGWGADPSGPASRVLDAGCGPGWETAAFADAGLDPVAIDLTAAFATRTAARVPAAGVARADMRVLPVAADRFDGLWACASFLHVPRGDAPGTLSEFARVLRPGGAFAFSVKRGEGRRVGDTYDGDRRQFTLYEPDELRGLLADAGFGVVTLDVGSAEGDPDAWLTGLARLES